MHARDGPGNDEPLDFGGAFEDGVDPERGFTSVHVRPLASEFVQHCSCESGAALPKVGMKVGMADLKLDTS
jgi:hypothetical protein